MDESIMIFAIIAGAVICGAVGAVLGRTVGKVEPGWWLGFFLGPIGWVIVFLLPRDNQKARFGEVHGVKGAPQAPPIRPPRTRDLSEDSYKIWLVKRYGIERNEALGQFICNERLFSSLEDALSFADSLEREKFARAQQVREESEQEESDEIHDNRLVIGLVAVVALVCITLVLIGFLS